MSKFTANFSPQDSMLFEGSPEVILFLDLQGRIEAANHRVFEWIKIPPKQLVGKSILDLAILTPKSRELVKKNFRLRLNQKEIAPYEIEVIDPSGQSVVGRVSGRLIEKDGRPVGVLIMVANVTQLEKELQNRLFRALESESRYMGLFENMSSAATICEYDEKNDEYVVQNVNRAFLKTEKATKRSVLGHTLQEVLNLEKNSELYQSIKKAQKTEIPQSFLLEIEKENITRILRGTIYRLQTSELTIIYDDVTQELAAQSELEKNEIKFRTTFNKANDSLFIMSGNEFIDCNKKTIEMFGLTEKSDIIGHTPIEFSPQNQPDGISSTTKALQYIKKAQDGRPQRFYWQHIKKNGDLFDVEVSLNRFYLNNELFLLAIVRNTTEELATKRSLSVSEHRFRSVVENAPAIIFSLNPDGTFALLEGKKLSLLGLKPGAMIGESIYESFKEYPNIITGVRAALGGETFRDILFIQDVYLDIFYSPLKDSETGELLGVIGMAVDVTESEKFKEHLVELDHSKSEFISTASHQLRSPLVNVRWGLEILMTDPIVTGNEALKHQMESIHTSSLKVIDLVNNLLDTSRIYSNKLVNKPKKLEAVKAISELLENSQFDKNRLGLEVIWNGPEQLEFKVDHNLFKAVVGNLLSNAVKYNKHHGVLAIYLKEKENWVDIVIANTGRPIPKDEQPRIFERFFRGSNVTMEFEGTGLGLYITKSYMKFLGGDVTFESGVKFGAKSINGEDFSGTIFKLHFPK